MAVKGVKGREMDTSSHWSEHNGVQRGHSMPTFTFTLNTAFHRTHDLATHWLGCVLATSWTDAVYTASLAPEFSGLLRLWSDNGGALFSRMAVVPYKTDGQS